jgi:serine/threonine protein kinase
MHGDVKPDDLFLLAGLRVKVLDFGLAKLRHELSGASQDTRAGMLLGTPRYMSPEQCLGAGTPIDHRTDVYALGVILYQMLGGSPPFVSDGLGEVLLHHISARPPPRGRRGPHHRRDPLVAGLARTPGRACPPGPGAVPGGAGGLVQLGF